MFFAICALFYFVAGDQIQTKRSVSPQIVPDGIVGELIDGVTIDQEFLCNQKKLEAISLMFTNYMRENTGTVKLVLKDKNTNTILAETSLDVAAVTPDMQYNWNMDPVVDDVENKELILSIMSDSKSGEGISVYCNSTLNTGDKALYRKWRSYIRVSCHFKPHLYQGIFGPIILGYNGFFCNTVWMLLCLFLCCSYQRQIYYWYGDAWSMV